MANGTGWQEEFLNEEGKRDPQGTREKEERFFDRIAEEIKKVVRHFAEDNGRPMRANHAKLLASVVNAELHVSPEIPSDLAVGFLKEPRKVYRAHVRFSNASSESKEDDSKPDLRGVAIRVLTEGGDHDFLMTNAEVHHARDAREAMAAIMAAMKKDTVEDLIPGVGPVGEKIAALTGALPHLVSNVGLDAARRIASTLKGQMAREVRSLATETYWSRAPIAIGNVPDPEQSVAVKYRLAPADGGLSQAGNAHDLGQELKTRINQGEVRFLLQVQRYIDPQTTPIEDATVRWPSPFETIAELVIPKDAGCMDDPSIDGLAFSPWNVDPTCFQPLGSMNRSRRKVYEASASLR